MRSPPFNVSGLLNEFFEANKEGTNHSTISLPTPVKWQPPPMNFLRLDVDASFPECSEFLGVGGVLRNHDGNLVAAFGRTFPKTDSIVLGELLEIKEGLMTVKESNVIIYFSFGSASSHQAIGQSYL